MSQVRRLILLWSCTVAPVAAELPVRLVPHRIAVPGGEVINGAALTGSTLFTWGDRLRWWALPAGSGGVAAPGARYGRAGCVLDVNADGLPDVLLNEDRGELVWREAPNWTRHWIDSGIETPDILPAELHGRRGILIVQKFIQLRFYEIPGRPAGAWTARDIYSFYTPSRQAGLLLRDVDGDGRADIFCGNYWVRSPERFELPWRLFAINTWNETPDAAMDRLALAGLVPGRLALIVSEAAVANARLAWFEKPPDPRQLWVDHRLEGSLGLQKPRGLAVADLDDDGRPEVIVGEDNGPGSRLLVFHNEGAGSFRALEIDRGSGIHTVIVSDINGDGRPDLVTIGPRSIAWWENAGRRRPRASNPRGEGRKGP